jgi:hypothetical protein
MVATPRPYSFTKLINSLSSTTELDNTTSWERGLGERCGKLFNQTLHRSQREQGCFIPPAAMVRDLLSTPASAGGDLIATSVLKVAEAIRPQTILEAAGVQRIEVAGDNLTMAMKLQVENLPRGASVLVDLEPMPIFNKCKLLNLGMDAASGDIITFLDADAVVGSDFGAMAQQVDWDRVHRLLRITKPFYDRFTPAISASDFALKREPEADLGKALDFVAVCRR